MCEIDRKPFPRAALFGAGALVALSIAAAAWVRPSDAAATAAMQADVTRSAQLRFADATDGAVIVSDARTARVVARLAPGTNGFVRGVMRGMARDRRARGIGDETPFSLRELSDGRLLLRDGATGREITLHAFGADNRAAFARLLAEAEPIT
ncbi:MAG: hypothetical protein GC206_02290 [Alphaproteobacteria bacterium]|nr:hypothetical protein [Alphaproteobacteria bacterium]